MDRFAGKRYSNLDWRNAVGSWTVDFGLATIQTERAEQSRVGLVVGLRTKAMGDQFAGRIDRISQRRDGAAEGGHNLHLAYGSSEYSWVRIVVGTTQDEVRGAFPTCGLHVHNFRGLCRTLVLLEGQELGEAISAAELFRLFLPSS
jgi:hypothetical protein